MTEGRQETIVAAEAAPPATVPGSEWAEPGHESSAPSVARRYRLVVLAGGAGLFAYLLHAIGPTAVIASFRVLSWRLVLVIVFPTVVLKACDALGWRCALPHQQVSLWRLATVLVAGQAVASTTSTGAFGEDAVKAWLLRDEVSGRDTVSSLIIVETTSNVSKGLLLLIGILIARQTLPSSGPLLRIMEWLLVLEILAVAGFIVVQLHGIAARGHGVLRRLGLAAGSQAGAAAVDVDRALVTFYRCEPRRLALSVAWSFLGWLSAALEIWLILYLLKTPVSAGVALVIEAFGTGISFATFFLPVEIGIDEGGAVATFLALHMSGATGMSLSLVRRVREMSWIALGLLILAGRPRPTAVAIREREH